MVLGMFGTEIRRNSRRVLAAAENTEKIMNDATRHLTPREVEKVAEMYDREGK